MQSSIATKSATKIYLDDQVATGSDYGGFGATAGAFLLLWHS